MAPQETRLGRVVSVSGSEVVMLFEPSGETSTDTLQAPPQIGKVVKMLLPDHSVFALVTGLSIPIPRPGDSGGEMKIVELEMLGETVNGARGSFQPGVSLPPNLGDNVYSTTLEDLREVYANQSEASIRIGTIYQGEELPAEIPADDLIGKHVAVVGTNETGKSCGVSLILHAILDHQAGMHVVVLDPHNEYAHVFGKNAELLSLRNLILPYWFLNSKEINEVIFGPDAPSYPVDVAILSELITNARRHYVQDQEKKKLVTVDTPIPYQITDLLHLIDVAIAKHADVDKSVPYIRLRERINLMRLDSRYSFMFGGQARRDNMVEILSRIFRLPDSGKPVTVMDLSGVPSEVLDVVVSVLARSTFEFALWSNRSIPIMLVCEDADSYAPQDPKLGFQPAKTALSRIAKEGGKYGVSLFIVSNRPSELAADILPRCDTFIAMRTSNDKDREFIAETLWRSTAGSLDCLSSLRNTEAIAWGDGISVPIRLFFDELAKDRRPLGQSAHRSATLKPAPRDSAFLTEVVDRWRYQDRESA